MDTSPNADVILLVWVPTSFTFNVHGRRAYSIVYNTETEKLDNAVLTQLSALSYMDLKWKSGLMIQCTPLTVPSLSVRINLI